MKLNHDCVRSLMLYIEENLDLGYRMEISQISLENYDTQELLYTAIKLNEAGYITAKVARYLNGNCSVSVFEITWEGHKFLDTIRDSKVWSHTKSILSKLSSTSITFVSTVASQVITNLITQTFAMPPVT